VHYGPTDGGGDSGSLRRRAYLTALGVAFVAWVRDPRRAPVDVPRRAPSVEYGYGGVPLTPGADVTELDASAAADVDPEERYVELGYGEGGYGG
jgi:hypothetical protein